MGTSWNYLKKSQFWKKILGSSQSLFHLRMTEVLSGLCVGKVGRSWLWPMALGQGQVLSWSTAGLGNRDVKKSPKTGAFPTEKQCWLRNAKWALQGIKASSLATSMTAVLLHSKLSLIEFGQDCSPPVDFLRDLLLYCGFVAEPPPWKLINIPEDTPEQEIIVLLCDSGVNRISLLSKTPSGKRKLSS